MDSGWRHDSIRVTVEAEEGSEGEMLHHREFGQNLCVVHFDHSLDESSLSDTSSKRRKKSVEERLKTYFVDLTPASLDSRDVIKHRAVLPEWALLHIVDEPNCREIEVRPPFTFHNYRLHDSTRVGSIW